MDQAAQVALESDLAKWQSIRIPHPMYSTAMLFDSSLVTITVRGTGPAKQSPKTFTLPRAVICAMSEYLSTAFVRKDDRKEPLETELDDV
ncbi:hypothetical protein Slin15195_G118340 [Septoria linicola]|uniref:Uncharacterized protein n=1 Tax=Septoria linicola TaxID=215465 RepID=A0A9Q9EPW8_9PEZI|nr:hypothetical protein Slin14017_G095330 [Septoria linicola]USW58515.1 hypothetical protein Slin15195_G118340 [Septoria linicola]